GNRGPRLHHDEHVARKAGCSHPHRRARLKKARLMKPRTVVFDAYGTLLDLHSAVLRDGHGIMGDLRALSELWRQRQLEYTWLRSLMERYEDFRILTEAALLSAVGQLR